MAWAGETGLEDDDDEGLGGSGGGRSFLGLAGVDAYHRKGDARIRCFRPEIAQRLIMVNDDSNDCLPFSVQNDLEKEMIEDDYNFNYCIMYFPPQKSKSNVFHAI